MHFLLLQRIVLLLSMLALIKTTYHIASYAVVAGYLCVILARGICGIRKIFVAGGIVKRKHFSVVVTANGCVCR